MSAVGLLALLVYTVGAFAYGAVLALWVRERDRRRRTAGRDDPGARGPSEPRVNGVLFAVSFAWFVVNLLSVLLAFAGLRSWMLDLAAVWIALIYPPIIMHMTWGEVSQSRQPVRARGWGLALAPAYAVAVGLAAVSTAGFAGIGGVSTRTVSHATSLALAGFFVLASIYCIALISRRPAPPRTARERQSLRWLLRQFAAMVAIFLLVILLNDRRLPLDDVGRLIELVAKSLPLSFLFVGSYFENRFEFFDLFIKRGLALVVTIAVLAGAFALTLPLLGRFEDGWARPWIYAVVLLPAVTALPWLYAWTGAVLDRRWLGRRFSTVEAVTRFLAGLRSATTKAQAVESARLGLTEIFGAPVSVQLSSPADASPTRFDVVQRTAIRAGDRTVGWFLLGRRASEAPYFSEDVALLGSLADVFASVLDNLDLQRREQEQDRRAREMTLHASRSELKALRAQINPHFLFNALNSIAGLIHRDPAVADRTIEKLADVFRYALRAESEWAVLDDELEFVRAYLDVEQARFGPRLTVDVQLDDGARGARVPTMVVQTLVENAVKHGVASVRGPAVVTVHAGSDGHRLRIEVSDNGPGFDATAAATSAARAGGYGLANVRQRLDGYFGPAAALELGRDPTGGTTTVSVTMPFLLHEPRSRMLREETR